MGCHLDLLDLHVIETLEVIPSETPHPSADASSARLESIHFYARDGLGVGGGVAKMGLVLALPAARPL